MQRGLQTFESASTRMQGTVRTLEPIGAALTASNAILDRAQKTIHSAETQFSSAAADLKASSELVVNALRCLDESADQMRSTAGTLDHARADMRDVAETAQDLRTSIEQAVSLINGYRLALDVGFAEITSHVAETKSMVSALRGLNEDQHDHVASLQTSLRLTWVIGAITMLGWLAILIILIVSGQRMR